MQGEIINGFVLKKLLGRGGMAEVWYAENEIGKPAAVKILNESLAHNQQIVERFHNEALVMVKLDHPNIRQVYGYGYLGNRHCIVMEYLEGGDLEELMKSGKRFTDEELRRWWNQAVDALNYTHAMDVVHRDIKPSNLFLDKRGNIKLLDFGIAKMMENASMTQTGMVMGTPMYMSPEQVNDIKHVDYHTDLYSLAVSFVHMLTGKKPYDDTNCSVFEIQMNIVTKPLDLSEVPATWQGFLAPYLEKDPQKRPALRHFEAVMPKEETAKAVADKNDTRTVVDNVKQSETKPVVEPTSKPQPKKADAQPVAKPQPKPETIIAPTDGQGETPKSKKGLWIGIGIGAAALVALLVVLLMKPRIDPDTEAYQACTTVNDYRAYMHEFGSKGHHYNEAKAEVDKYVADSTVKAQQALAEMQAKQQDEAEVKAKAEAEAAKDEEASYKKCTSIAACDAYLKAYANGKYVKEVKAKKAELEKKEKKQNKVIRVVEDVVISTEVEQNEIIEEYIAPAVVEEKVVEQEIFNTVDEMPQYPGGESMMLVFITRNLQYPQAARDAGIQGRVFVSFVVEPDGSLSNVKIMRGIGGGCDEEAVRVVKSMPKWKPGKQRGKAVRVSYLIPVFFQL